jgi:ferredoxin
VVVQHQLHHQYCKDVPESAPAPLKPWFAIPGPVTDSYSVVFGHWASLEGKGTPEGIYAYNARPVCVVSENYLMALLITKKCINCDMCEPECPNEAISAIEIIA